MAIAGDELSNMVREAHERQAREVWLSQIEKYRELIESTERGVRESVYRASQMGIAQREIAARCGRTQSWVSTVVREEGLRERILEGDVTFGYCPSVNGVATDHWVTGTWDEIEHLYYTGKVTKRWFEEMLEIVRPKLEAAARKS